MTGVTERIEQGASVWAKSTPTLRAKVYKSENLTDMGLIRSNGIARKLLVRCRREKSKQHGKQKAGKNRIHGEVAMSRIWQQCACA